MDESEFLLKILKNYRMNLINSFSWRVPEFFIDRIYFSRLLLKISTYQNSQNSIGGEKKTFFRQPCYITLFYFFVLIPFEFLTCSDMSQYEDLQLVRLVELAVLIVSLQDFASIHDIRSMLNHDTRCTKQCEFVRLVLTCTIIELHGVLIRILVMLHIFSKCN